MFKKLSNRLFFILVFVLIVSITYLRHPYFRSKYSKSYRSELFSEFKSDLDNNLFDAEKYWQFREQFSPGNFLRDEEFTDFFSTFRIINLSENGLTPLFYYQSDKISSLDALIDYDTGTALDSIKNEFEGEVVSTGDDFILLKTKDSEYVFAFVEVIDEMKRVNGMFDYIPKEMDLLNNQLWYNVTYIELN